MATLVTGGTGFIGANIVKALVERGHQVVSLDIEPVVDLLRNTLGTYDKQVTWLQGDILDKGALEKAASSANIDKIVHCATFSPYGDDEYNHCRRVIDINMEGTVNMLDLARQVGVKRFIYMSSVAVYTYNTPTDVPFREDMPLEPKGLYPITKFASEGLTERYSQLYGFEAASMRLSHNWGPMERVTPYRARMCLPYEWAAKAARGEPIEPTPFGSGRTEGRRLGLEHPYVYDTAACVGVALDAPKLKYSAYNISSGHRITLHEMVAAMREAYPAVKFVEPIPEEDASKPLGVSWDLGRMKDDLDYTPKYDLISALRDYINWRLKHNFLN